MTAGTFVIHDGSADGHGRSPGSFVIKNHGRKEGGKEGERERRRGRWGKRITGKDGEGRKMEEKDKEVTLGGREKEQVTGIR